MTERTGFLNRNQLKYLVIAAMLIDHIAWAFVPTASLLGQAMHIIGRLTPSRPWRICWRRDITTPET